MQNKKSKIEQKLLKKLIKNEKFMNEILETKDSKNIIKNLIYMVWICKKLNLTICAKFWKMK